uniref:Uncharacterized protein n=1 Tax=viral metagenome TaxID=1070528 RepID=A0A6C0J727_9ZZZZ
MSLFKTEYYTVNEIIVDFIRDYDTSINEDVINATYGEQNREEIFGHIFTIDTMSAYLLYILNNILDDIEDDMKWNIVSALAEEIKTASESVDEYEDEYDEDEDDIEEWEQPPSAPSEDDWAQMKEAQFQRQYSERGGDSSHLMNAPEAQRTVYYSDMLGVNYLTKTLYDVIIMEDVTVKDYIESDKDNIVFVIQSDGPEVLFGSNRSHIASQMAIYDCDKEGTKYLSMNQIGYHAGAVMQYDAIKLAVLKSNYQIIALRPEGKTGKLITHEIRYYGDDAVSGLHCQEGSEQDYYSVHIP